MERKFTALQLATLALAHDGQVREHRFGYGAWRILGANPGTVGQASFVGPPHSSEHRARRLSVRCHRGRPCGHRQGGFVMAAPTLPDVLPGHWTTPEGHAKAVEYASLTRADLGMPDRPDLGLANALYLVSGEIEIQTAAKERMRWLSVQLAIVTADRDEARAALSDARDAFLNMIAEARRWDEDTDGEYDEGGARTWTYYFGEFNDHQVRELVEALGIQIDSRELSGDAIKRRLAADEAAFAAKVQP